MEIFRQLVSVLGSIPAWAPLILIPALAVAAAVLFALLGGRRAYAFLAAALGAVGFALMCCIGELYEAFIWAGLFAALAALLRLLFLIPRPRRRGRHTAREERIYERFRGEPLMPSVQGASDPAPAKVCCFEEEAPTQEPPELSHAVALLEKLRREKLSAADRLEADVLSRSVSALRGRALTETERGTLNDCLASVLKLTAKYKL